MPSSQQVHHRFARGVRVVVAAPVDCRRRRAAGQRHADRLADRGHRVRREHPRARALGRARVPLDLTELVDRDRAGGARADGLEDAHDVERHAVVVPGQDRAAVDEDRRQVEPGRGHQHPGQALVASGERDERVEALRVHHRLDRVGDHLATDERRAHALVTHRDAVAHRDRHELEREAARRRARRPSPVARVGRAACCTASPRSTTTRRRPGSCPSRRRPCRPLGASLGHRPSLVAVGDVVAADLHRVRHAASLRCSREGADRAATPSTARSSPWRSRRSSR